MSRSLNNLPFSRLLISREHDSWESSRVSNECLKRTDVRTRSFRDERWGVRGRRGMMPMRSHQQQRDDHDETDRYTTPLCFIGAYGTQDNDRGVTCRHRHKRPVHNDHAFPLSR